MFKAIAAFLWSFVIAGSAQAAFTLSFDPKVPYTLQTLAVMLGSCFFGEWSAFSVLCYILEGISRSFVVLN
jgi:biotin transporter BioY